MTRPVSRIGPATLPDDDPAELPPILEPDEVAGLTDLMDEPAADEDAPPVRIPGRRITLTPDEAAMLVGAAAGGDHAAWDALVDAYGGLIWTVARNHRLSPGDAGDVSQTTWLRLVENIDRLSEPSRVGAWLATTARRECLRLLGRSKRTVLSGEELDPGSDRLRLATPEADAALLAAERDAEMRTAFGRLTPRCRELLQLLLLDPAPSYDEISAALDIPIGSIGPTRGRCLEKLRAIVEDAGINPAAAGSS
ncbi:RNA polymerase sigma factor [Cryptosporangium phraense]|uniref:RNA polymerase sigma factor n=1 Tax=Cryptosporangium phraense TaxID=2593070 RepID=UPI00197ABFA0|nr:sigma-70 family RNA polymerase sigma factor [Cryptosporangium phraense]